MPTCWCGDAEGLGYVLPRLAELVIKPLARGIGRTHRNGWELSAAELEALRSRIEAEPYAWVGQEALTCSTAPSVVADDLRPQVLTLRTFTVASGAGYQVMTGGLGQVSTPHEGLTGVRSHPRRRTCGSATPAARPPSPPGCARRRRPSCSR